MHAFVCKSTPGHSSLPGGQMTCRLYHAGPQPFKLSLRGATAITHDAVSSLLRLPMLSELRIDGCPKIQALDKMRLIAKVRTAGRPLTVPQCTGVCIVPELAQHAAA